VEMAIILIVESASGNIIYFAILDIDIVLLGKSSPQMYIGTHNSLLTNISLLLFAKS
jgi:hypothetical protein